MNLINLYDAISDQNKQIFRALAVALFTDKDEFDQMCKNFEIIVDYNRAKLLKAEEQNDLS